MATVALPGGVQIKSYHCPYSSQYPTPGFPLSNGPGPDPSPSLRKTLALVSLALVSLALVSLALVSLALPLLT